MTDSAAQLMLALDYCHKLGVSSRDIKLENTLLEKAPGRRPMLKLCGVLHCGAACYSCVWDALCIPRDQQVAALCFAPLLCACVSCPYASAINAYA